jgi:hypothetical protein
MLATVPTFHIFDGCFPGKDVLWLESVQGLAAAKERMEQIAAEKPGPYFVFNVPDKLVMATTDTTPRKAKNEAASPEKASGAA